MTSYIDIKELKNNGISFNLLKDKIKEYAQNNLNNKVNEHKIDLTKKISVRIRFKDFKKLALEADEHKNTLKDVVTASIYSGKKKIKSLDSTQFVNDFSKELRSLGTVYIIGDPEAVPLANAGSSVKAQIRTDFVQSLLSGSEGTISSTDNAGDSNIPLQSIADVFAVISKSMDYSQLGIDSVSPVPTNYNTLQSINKTSVCQIKRILGYLDDPFNGTEAGVDGDLVLSYADGGLVPVFQLYYSNLDNGIIYIRRRIGYGNTMTRWSRIVDKDFMNSNIELGTRPIQNFINEINLQIKPTVGVLLSESNSNGYPITSVTSSFPCYIGNDQIVYTNASDGGRLYLKSATEADNGVPINSVFSTNACYIGNNQIVYTNWDDDRRMYIKSATGTDNGTLVQDVRSDGTCYIGNNQIVYQTVSNSFMPRLYLKSLSNTGVGTIITSVNSYSPCYIGGGQVVYRNDSDGGRLYIKSSTGTDNGTPITNGNSYTPCYVGNNKIAYCNIGSGQFIFLKTIKNLSFGININSQVANGIEYIGNGKIVYRNNSNGLLYNKNLFDYK